MNKIKSHRRNRSSLLVVFCLASTIAEANIQTCAVAHGSEHGLLSTPNLVRVGMPESTIREARSTFSYDEAGHFGTKTQYNSTKVDASGGSLVVHCRDGVCFGVEVKYGETGIKRADATALMRTLLSVGDASPVEHDDADITKNDAKKRAEFFYFDKGLRGELYYALAPSQRVNQIAVWHDEPSEN